MSVIAVLSFVTGLAAFLVASVLLAFSDFIMRALVRAKPSAAIEVMQEINLTVFRSIFLTIYLILVPALLALSARVWSVGPDPAGLWVLAGTGLYVTGSFLVTMFGNVPMNRKLAAKEAGSAEAAAYWTVYGRRWARFNTLRTLAGMAAAFCLFIAGWLSIV
jgi:uncharacterized membrane protein